MLTPEPTPQEALLPVPPEFQKGLDNRSWSSVSKALLGWALCTLRLAVREADAFFQIYKHAREDNKKLRRLLAEHNIEAPPYDWRLDEALIMHSHKAVPTGLWGYDEIDEPMSFGVDYDFKEPVTALTISTTKQLAKSVEQTEYLEGFLGFTRDEFYEKDIEKGGWRVKRPAEVK